MATSGTVTINIVGDATRLKSALGSAEGDLESFGDKMKSLGTKMMAVGAGMTAGITLPLALLGKASFDAASDLNESMSKVNVVFAENAEVIKAWSKGSAESMGLSRQAALEAAGTFGNLFRALGVEMDPATDMSQALVQLAVDLASFNNIDDPEEVLIKLRAGLVGEAEPLRSLGIALSATAVEAKAFQMRAEGVTGELTEGEKVAARYALIMEQSALAQGDFARTSEGAAAQQKVLAAQFADMKATLGQALLPIFLEVAEAVKKLGEWFQNLSPQMQKFVVYGGLAAAALGPLATTMGAIVTLVGIFGAGVGAVVLAIGALIAVAVLLYLKWDEVWNAVAKHPALLLILAPLGAILLPIIALVGAIKLVQANWETIWPILQGLVEGAGAIISPVLSAIDSAARAIADAAVWLWGVWQAAWPTIQAILEVAWSVMQGILAAAASMVSAIGGAAQFLWDVWQAAWPVIQSVTETAWGIMQGPLNALLGVLDGIIGAAVWVKDQAGAMWDGFVASAGALGGVINGPLGALLGTLNGIASAARAAKAAVEALPNVSGPGGPGLNSQIDDWGGVGKGFGNGAFGSRRAAGGPVLAGASYLVGERGPELLQMGSGSGTIIPNHALGSNNTYSINVTVAPGGSPAETGRAIVEAIKSYEDRSGATWRAA